jgi:outer membrane protein OmpA-like peptidoglycan-associated protein
LPCGKNYGVYANADGFTPVALNLDLSKSGSYSEQVKDILMVPLEAGQVVRLNNIFFDSNKSDLKPESFPELERLIKLLRQNPSMHIEIAGHSDDTGDDEVNNRISFSRAESVRVYLEQHGVKGLRAISKGYGKAKPVASNDTYEGRQLNRRVEFVILRN